MQLICLSCGLNPLGSITARHPTALLQGNQIQNDMNEEHRVEILTGCVILLNMGYEWTSLSVKVRSGSNLYHGVCLEL